MTTGPIVVLAGGVGAARILRGMTRVVPPQEITAIVNTADDTTMHGLAICPDLDTVTYTLAAAIDPQRGWGLVDETWHAMDALARYTPARPDGSSAGSTWFSLGDRDLATHMYRTARLHEGATLSAVAQEIAAAWGVDVRLVPMTDDRVETRVTVQDPDGVREVAFQEYFVQRHHDVAVTAVRFDGAATAAANGLDEIAAARTIVIAPSNPIVSIGPIRALAGVDAALAARRDSVVAVSPIVGGAALKGPADRMLRELGHEPSVVGVAALYSPVAATLVIDPVDAHLAGAVEDAGMRCLVTPSVMRTLDDAAALSRATLAAAVR